MLKLSLLRTTLLYPTIRYLTKSHTPNKYKTHLSSNWKPSNNIFSARILFIIKFKLIFFFLGISKCNYLPDPLYCPRNCGHYYTGVRRKGNLNIHLKYKCGVPKQFVCTICCKFFAQKYILKSHYGAVHKIICQ